MSYKKQIVTVITLLVILLLTMSTTIQAANVGKVYGLNATMNGSQIKLTWDYVSGAMGYNVYVNNTRIGSVSTDEATLIGFSNNTTYRFKIAAYDSQRKEGIASTEFSLTTDGRQTLGKVEGLTVSQVNGYVTLNWNTVSYANKYQVFVDIPNFGEINVGEVTTTNAMLQGFKEGQNYGFCIRACQTLNSGGMNYGEKSNRQYCTINSNQDDDYSKNEGKVTGVYVKDITDTEATVTWNKMNEADGYEIEISKNNGSYKKIGDTTNTYVYLSNLDANSYYKVRIIAYEYKTNGIKRPWEESDDKDFTTKRTQDTDVNDVVNVTISDITKNSAYASWPKVSNAEGYNIYLSKDGGRNFKYWDSTSLTHYDLYSLEQNTYYQIKVEGYKFVNGREYTGRAYTRGFTTSQQKIGQVTGVYVEDVKDTQATVNWSYLNNADSYEVRVSKNYGDYKTVADKTTTKVCLSNLTPDSYYRVKIVAYQWQNGQKQYGDESDYASFYTPETTTVGKITNINTSNNSSSGIRISWSKANNATEYNIYLSENNERNFRYQASTTATNYTFNNLKPATRYYVKVEGYKIVGGREYTGGSYTKSFVTANETTRVGGIQRLKAEVKNRNEAYLSWWQTEGATGYEIYLAKEGEDFERIDYQKPNSYIITSDKLEYSTNYEVKVRAYKIQWDQTKGDYYTTFGNYSKTSFRTQSYDRTQNNAIVGKVGKVNAPVSGDAVSLSWPSVYGAAGYEIDFYVPFVGNVPLYSNTNYKRVTGITHSDTDYMARIRAYKYINGAKVYGEYSDPVRFRAAK